MTMWEMRAALELLGFSPETRTYGTLSAVPKRRRGWWGQLVGPNDLQGLNEVQWVGRPTLVRWLRERDGNTFDSPCVLSIGGDRNGHFVVQGNHVADNQQGLMPVEQSRYRRWRVCRALILPPG